MGCYPQLWWSVLQQRESHSIIYSIHIPPLGGMPNPSAFPAALLSNFMLQYKEYSGRVGAGSSLFSWGENSHRTAASLKKLPDLRTGCSWMLQLGWMHQELEDNGMGWLLSFKLSGSQRESFRIRAFSLSQALEEMLSRVCSVQALSSLYSHTPQPLA